jgi:hypothetical protein
MPYGLPGALKLARNAIYCDASGKQALLPRDTLIQPLYPHADQDGYDGEWRVVAVTKAGKVECSIMFPK